MSKEQAAMIQVNAANQVLYNSFLTAGLLWRTISQNSEIGFQFNFLLKLYLCCWPYSDKTLHLKIFFIQTIPATIALAVSLLN